MRKDPKYTPTQTHTLSTKINKHKLRNKHKQIDIQMYTPHTSHTQETHLFSKINAHRHKQIQTQGIPCSFSQTHTKYSTSLYQKQFSQLSESKSKSNSNSIDQIDRLTHNRHTDDTHAVLLRPQLCHEACQRDDVRLSSAY